MQSSGGWTSITSQGREQSVDSSSGTDAFSLINANPALSETSYLDIEATSNMTLPLRDDQSSSENLPPIRSSVVDWVQDQSQHDQLSNDATGLQRAPLNETSAPTSQPKQAHARTRDTNDRQEGRQTSKRVYDIATLLRLKETQSAVPVMLRVKPEAIAENIFQYMGAATSRQIPARSRGFSDISNISNGVTAKQNYMTQPYRQPHAPPESSILQRHDGFARFLKQHASPPHNRVTAGGRIVPAGPTSPPPMLDFGSLNGLLRERPETAKSFQKDNRSTQSNSRAQNPQVASSMTLGDYLQSQSGNVDAMGLQNSAQNAPMQKAIPFNSTPFGYQSFVAPAMQTQAAMVPLAMFPDGSTIVSYNGMNFRASWNGMNMTMEPLQPTQLPVDQQYYPQAYPQGYLNTSHFNIVSQPPLAPVPSAPLASATNSARPDIARLPQSHPMNGDEHSFKTQLTDLDKYLALYHFEITPAERASLIVQRRFLVEELDKIRLNKEKPKHSIPIIAPAVTGLPVTPGAQPVPGLNGSREAARNGQTAKGGTARKHLSPAAAAFVPRNFSNVTPAAFGMRTASQQTNPQQVGMRAPSRGIDSAPKAQNKENSSSWMSHSDHKGSFPKSQAITHNELSSSSSVLDPSDPAMRVVDYEDIEYAGRYLYNGTKDTKIYCTTVAEFQEAIRRIREQARLYGCAGGQSKDPAYDAEQDVWWAICDRDPIPLPSEVPDHVANPRPWNWNDSAFNYRRQGFKDAPGPGCEHARTSPRIFGWDPATTDKMKDVMDVSRSYFALKGQLPSVSFRDFAYDRDGKKRLIQSDTAAPTAYAAASKHTAQPGNSTMASSRRDEIDSSFDSSALQEKNTSELNFHPTSSAFVAQYKQPDNGKSHEAASLRQGIPRTPEHRRMQRSFEANKFDPTTTTANSHLTNGHGFSESKNTNTAYDHCQAYVEDYPETPAARGIRSASKGAGALQMKTTPSNVYMDPILAGTGGARMRSFAAADALESTAIVGATRESTEEELDSIWYHTPLDEVTQKYLDDMKAYNPLKNKQVFENDRDLDPTKERRQTSDSSEPVTESKSPWGPEEGTEATIPSGSNQVASAETHARALEHGEAKTATVKIPNVSPIRAPIPRANKNNPFSAGHNAHNALNAREVNAVNVASVGGNDSHQFLRKMLKSPCYSSAQPMSILSQISSTLADKIGGNKRARAKGPEQQPENTGNGGYNIHGNIGNGLHAISGPSSSVSVARTSSNLGVGKTQSSLASSTYQAQGYLPQFDGASMAHTSSLYRDQGIQPLPQVRLPSEVLYSDRQRTAETSNHQIHGPNAYTASTTYHNSVNFGYDGGRDSPPPKATNAPKEQQSTRPAFDAMGVTLADYDERRGDTNNAWHHGAVEDFFQDLHEQELKTVASHRRINTQSAA